jgi:hypothetical protein
LTITGFIWLDEIVEKLAWKHHVEPHEVEELFTRAPRFRFVERGNRDGEDVYAALLPSEKDMPESKSPISNASSPSEIGEYWDTHDLADHWDQTHEVDFDVRLESSVMYFAVEKSLAEKLRAAARDHGVSPETLLNVWVQEHVTAEQSAK